MAMILCSTASSSPGQGRDRQERGSQAERGTMAGACQRHILELAGACDEGEKTTNGQRRAGFVTTMEDGTPVFANVELAGRKLIVEVNSAARAEKAIAQMGEWLGDCVSTPMTEIRTLAQFMADDAARAPQEEPLDIPPDEMERIVHDMLTREYTKTLDEAVPALGNKTPRALARTKAGRAKVADWLKYIENGAAKSGVGEPMATYDFTWMWQELGIIGLRR